jgi:hypothetical protein
MKLFPALDKQSQFQTAYSAFFLLWKASDDIEI